MTEGINIFGFTLNFYGLIIGLAIYLAIFLIEKKAFSADEKKNLISQDLFQKLIFMVIFSGVVGARLWHVATDFNLYENDFFSVFKIWEGGLSILGGIFGGFLGAIIFLWKREGGLGKLKTAVDLSVFGLPFGQALGRFGNYVNQELYGAPTNLPWKIFIDPEKRVAGYENYPYFHPLFLYESLLMLLFGLGMWVYDRFSRKNGKKIIGEGKYFAFYLVFYGVVRFFLDFLRIDNAKILLGLGANQLIILFLLIVAMFFFVQKNRKILVFFIITFAFMIISANFFQAKKVLQGEISPPSISSASVYQNLQKVPDRQIVQIFIGEQKLNVEIVNTEPSRTLGLSGRETIGTDGMLFVFPQKSYQQFWMKDMKFNLDFIWFADGKVVEIMKNVPRPEAGQSLETLPRFVPRQPVEMMLEVVAGDAESRNLREGDEIGVMHEL